MAISAEKTSEHYLGKKGERDVPTVPSGILFIVYEEVGFNSKGSSAIKNHRIKPWRYHNFKGHQNMKRLADWSNWSIFWFVFICFHGLCLVVLVEFENWLLANWRLTLPSAALSALQSATLAFGHRLWSVPPAFLRLGEEKTACEFNWKKPSLPNLWTGIPNWTEFYGSALGWMHGHPCCWLPRSWSMPTSLPSLPLRTLGDHWDHGGPMN